MSFPVMDSLSNPKGYWACRLALEVQMEAKTSSEKEQIGTSKKSQGKFWNILLNQQNVKATKKSHLEKDRKGFVNQSYQSYNNNSGTSDQVIESD